MKTFTEYTKTGQWIICTLPNKNTINDIDDVKIFIGGIDCTEDSIEHLAEQIDINFDLNYKEGYENGQNAAISSIEWEFGRFIREAVEK